MGDAKALLRFLMSWTCTTPAELRYCRSISSLVLTSLSTQIHHDTPLCHDALLLEMQSDDSASPRYLLCIPRTRTSLKQADAWSTATAKTMEVQLLPSSLRSMLAGKKIVHDQIRSAMIGVSKLAELLPNAREETVVTVEVDSE